MAEGNNNREGGAFGWLDRLAHVLAGEPKDREELVELLRDAEQRNLLDADVLNMVEGALQVAEMQVRDIMIPRNQMVAIEYDLPPEEFVETVVQSGHSRFPVIGENRDEVIGILLAKDLLGYFASDPAATQTFDTRDAMRPAVFVPESKRLNVLLRDFRSSRNHMAIVVDEYGGIAGLVTIEDVLEQIVGDIGDEHDTDEERFVKQIGEGEYIVKAQTPLEDFNEAFGLALASDQVDTVGGLVVREFGYLPRRNETCSLAGLHFTVVRADKRRVLMFRVRTDGDDARA